jgi:hypothetical protein
MNNFRLSTYEGPIEVLNIEEINKIVNAAPFFEYLGDGRVRDLSTNSIITAPNSCVYEVIRDGDTILLDSLKEVLATVGVGFRTLKKQLETKEITEIKGYIIKRISVFSKR